MAVDIRLVSLHRLLLQRVQYRADCLLIVYALARAVRCFTAVHVYAFRHVLFALCHGLRCACGQVFFRIAHGICVVRQLLRVCRHDVLPLKGLAVCQPEPNQIGRIQAVSVLVACAELFRNLAALVLHRLCAELCGRIHAVNVVGFAQLLHLRDVQQVARVAVAHIRGAGRVGADIQALYHIMAEIGVIPILVPSIVRALPRRIIGNQLRGYNVCAIRQFAVPAHDVQCKDTEHDSRRHCIHHRTFPVTKQAVEIHIVDNFRDARRHKRTARHADKQHTPAARHIFKEQTDIRADNRHHIELQRQLHHRKCQRHAGVFARTHTIEDICQSENDKSSKQALRRLFSNRPIGNGIFRERAQQLKDINQRTRPQRNHRAVCSRRHQHIQQRIQRHPAQQNAKLEPTAHEQRHQCIAAHNRGQHSDRIHEQKAHGMRGNAADNLRCAENFSVAVRRNDCARQQHTDQIRREHRQNPRQRAGRKQLSAPNRQRMEKVRLIFHVQIPKGADARDKRQNQQQHRRRCIDQQGIAQILAHTAVHVRIAHVAEPRARANVEQRIHRLEKQHRQKGNRIQRRLPHAAIEHQGAQLTG